MNIIIPILAGVGLVTCAVLIVNVTKIRQAIERIAAAVEKVNRPPEDTTDGR